MNDGMKLATLPPRRDSVVTVNDLRPINLPHGADSGNPTKEQMDMLYEVYAKLSGIGEPPQLGSKVTLGDIQKAIRTSELGEPYWLWALNRDMIENDPHLQAEVGKRIMSFIGQEEKVEPFDKDKKEDVLAAEVVEDMKLNCENWTKGSLHLAMGHIWPIAGCEKIYRRVDERESRNWRHPVQFALHKLHPIPWPLFTYKIAYWNGTFSGATPQSGYVPMDIIDGSGSTPLSNGATNEISNNPALIWNPNDWHEDLRFYNTFNNGLIDWSMAGCYKADKTRHVLHAANVPTGSLRENFGGLLRSLIPIWFYKKNLLDWLVEKMERYGGPFAVAKGNIQNKDISNLLTKAFSQSAKLNALLVPNGTTVELKEVNSTNMADAFCKSIDLCNKEMTKAILGITLSTDSKGSGMMGGSGVADLQSDVKEEWSLFDKREFSEMQRIQIINDFLTINGYTGKCRIVRGGISSSAQAMKARTFQSLYLSGIRVPKSEEQNLTNTFGIKVEVFDPIQEKQEKSNSDKKKYGNPATVTKED